MPPKKPALTPKKRPKPARKPRKPAPKAVENTIGEAPVHITGATLLQKARRTVYEALEGVQRNLAEIEKMLSAKRAEGKYDTSLGSHHAWVLQKAVSALGEVRKLEAHDRKAGEDMTPEEEDAMLAEHVRELPVDRRQKLRGLLDELDAEGVL